MANFVQGNFVVPVTPEDTQVFIKDKFGRIRFTIAPYQVTATFVKNNLIHVKSIGTDNVILIDFGNVEEAKRALPELQIQLDIARKSPNNPSSDRFSYHQIFATSSWVVIHSLGYKPSVSVTDEFFEEIEGLIKYIDDNQLSVKFNQSLTGWVFCS